MTVGRPSSPSQAESPDLLIMFDELSDAMEEDSVEGAGVVHRPGGRGEEQEEEEDTEVAQQQPTFFKLVN